MCIYMCVCVSALRWGMHACMPTSTSLQHLSSRRLLSRHNSIFSCPAHFLPVKHKRKGRIMIFLNTALHREI
jgi:hypothetical protein